LGSSAQGLGDDEPDKLFAALGRVKFVTRENSLHLLKNFFGRRALSTQGLCFCDTHDDASPDTITLFYLDIPNR
jgi:hypothetical protein